MIPFSSASFYREPGYEHQRISPRGLERYYIVPGYGEDTATPFWGYGYRVPGYSRHEFIPSTLGTVKINNGYWAVPFNTNAGLLYYNDKKVHPAPTTWQQVLQGYQQANCKKYPGEPGEHLVVGLHDSGFSF